MALKNYFYLFGTSFCIFIFSLAGCSDDLENEDAWGIEFSYKKSPGDEKVWSINNKDTINVTVGDTIILYVDCKGGELKYLKTDDALETTDLGNGEYSVLIAKSGVGLCFFAIMNPDGLDPRIEKVYWFFLNSSVYRTHYYVASNSVEVEGDWTLQYIIETELEDRKLILPSDCRFDLESVSIYEGNLTCTLIQGDIIYGTYTSTNIFAYEEIVFHFNGLTYEFTMTKSIHVIGYFRQTLFEQDLTSLFRDKYPSVTGVFVTTLMLTYDQ